MEAFYRKNRSIGKDPFLRKYLKPFLAEVNPSAEPQNQQNAQFGTMVGAKAPSASVFFEEKQIKSDSRIFPLHKRVAVFPDKITVGRSANNDIVLDDALISKLQSYFVFEQEKVFITDADSKNGTFLDARKLPAMQKVECPNGSLISFGPRVKFILMSAELLWDNMILAMEK